MLKKSSARRVRSITLTPRDELIPPLVHELRGATVEQVQLMLGFGDSNRSRAQTRLGVLRHAGLLETLPGRAVNEPAVWVVSTKGLRTFGLDPDLPRRPKPGRLTHDLGVNDVRVRFVRACREPGLSLLWWRDEESLRPTTIRHGVLPDALFQFERETGDRRPKATLAVEVEVSTKSDAGLKQKLINYGSYYYGGAFETDFNTRALRVIVVVRAEHNVATARLVKRYADLADDLGVTFVRVAELDVFLSLRPAEAFSAPIWLQPGTSEPTALIPGGSQHGQSVAA